MDQSVKVTNEVLSFVQLVHSKKGVIKLPAHLPLFRGLELMAVKGDDGCDDIIKQHQKTALTTNCIRVLDLLKLPKNAIGARQALINANLWTETDISRGGTESSAKFGEVRNISIVIHYDEQSARRVKVSVECIYINRGVHSYFLLNIRVRTMG